MSEQKRLRKGQAYREYLAVRSFVDQKWEEGYDLMEIHEMLVTEKRITMSYSALHSNRKRVLAREMEKAQALGQVSTWPPQAAPRQPPKKRSGSAPPASPAMPPGPAPAQAALLPPAHDRPASAQWSLDRKLPALNLEAPTEPEEFDSTEVL